MRGFKRQWLCVSVATIGLWAGLLRAEVPTDLRGDIGGLWFDQQRNGQGLQIDLLDEQRAAVTWYTFDADGRPLWLFGLGEAVGTRMQVPMSSAEGGRFPTLAPNPPVQFSAAGQLTIEFASCDSAQLSWTSEDSALPDGEFVVQRLTRVAGERCNRAATFAEVRQFSFEHGANGFTPLFADLPTEGHDIYELDFAYEALPAPLAGRRGLRLTGMNRSDDLAMLITAPLAGLQPGQLYSIELEMEIASDVPRGCFGVGGSPGDSVYMKMGVTPFPPQAVAQDNGTEDWLRLNFDFGVQSEGGEQARVVGDLANRQDCSTDTPTWQLKRLGNLGRPLTAQADEQGRLWLVAGSDSAFEGLTSYYFSALDVRLRPLSSAE
ncbi:hypothetical protein [Pseudomarimonas arenosa]|uniref:Phytase-like domain-containing protein n=1 Tax=Pseudomarimonas arenosa TaxID=2774145 RepID=A0AAW3ZKI6_9GAMM|nr:hypothetical protein [Pseudomarimonas arenosa]MBD8524966.1 hypothetical protein [Pseudomarimonas arenosa]